MGKSTRSQVEGIDQGRDFWSFCSNYTMKSTKYASPKLQATRQGMQAILAQLLVTRAMAYIHRQIRQ